jgi:hypothetical protein
MPSECDVLTLHDWFYAETKSRLMAGPAHRDGCRPASVAFTWAAWTLSNPTNFGYLPGTTGGDESP